MIAVWLVLTIIGVLLLLAAAVPYIVYLFGISFGKKSDTINISSDFEYPEISIVVCAYNEELNIANKIQSISDCTYPKDKIEFILVIDCSNDKTHEIAENKLSKESFKWIIHENDVRSGKNGSLNNGINLASNEIIIDSDADVIWDNEAIERLVRRLCSDEKIAVVSGDLQPYTKGNTVTSIENKYRSYFGKMSEWEGANDATYIINGCLIAFKKSVVSEITTAIGPDDANIAFTAIRKGYRIVYDGDAKVFEELPETMKKQYSQKARRAKGIIQATLANRDILKQKRMFSKIFYPLRIWMYVLTPTLFFVGLAVFLAGVIIAQPLISSVLIIIAALILFFAKGNLITSFIINQFYLLAGLYSRRKDAVIWQSTSKKVGE
ncbi:MAG: glycosyltransferase [Methanocorpusculum sp.]|nr:glycosyltransferase [Methanocorpusculum sp.]